MQSQPEGELERIRDSWNALARVVLDLSDAQWVQLTDGHWSLQDHLAHITLAEQYVRAVLRGEPPHELFGVTPEMLLTLSEDELNEVGHELSETLTSDQVKELWQKTHQELLERLAHLTDTDLEKPLAPYGEPSGLTWRDILRGNTYEHYDNHRKWIQVMVEQAASYKPN